ncbi:2-hydroxyisoflavanone dehydratase [Quillaja saponaria]|uniref:2-hydroxyisoflavanone dehydratase n=1 Tax=Quillaja saponaria TaxID=32244 RepID=A0AAD7LCL7_QUISA|nr:2-hydroxyisoflavanone dehydratase [Quillaja saponaria]
MASTKEIDTELLPYLRVYKDGTLERIVGSSIVPSSPEDPENGVSSKDITISDNPSISARLYLPKLNQSSNNQQNQKLPILIYFHGGGFFIESAFSFPCHRFLNLIVSQANVLAVSMEYRLAPEHPLPRAYEDCWTALQWVTSHAFRAGVESLFGGVNIVGAFLSYPYFCGSNLIGSESVAEYEQRIPNRVWNLVYPDALGGIDCTMINPPVPGAPCLAGLGCSKMLACVAGKDELRDGGVWYYEAIEKSEWEGEVELFEVEDEIIAFISSILKLRILRI